MACPRGAASPDTNTRLRLFAASAGYCQNPACSRALFIDLPSGRGIHNAEMAHVFAANNQGPRANKELTKEERGAFDNLILLCPTCHKTVDKAPQEFPDTLLFSWKRNHANKLQEFFGVECYLDRATARKAIEAILRENRFIFDNYGPYIEQAADPESGASDRWERKVLTRILPNNRKILALLDANQHLLKAIEVDVLENFRQHVDDLEARHLEGFEEGGATFPPKMSDILGNIINGR